MKPFTTRFAPSPTGRLHLGHAYSACLAHDTAQANGGVFLLRIEDIDQGRCRPEFEAGIVEDLTWLGLTWPLPVRRQSEHMAGYAAALDRLRQLGVVYRCFLTRREIMEQSMSAPHTLGEGPEGVIYRGPAQPMSHDEEDLRVARGDPFAWRLSIRYSQDLLGEEFARLVFVERQIGSNEEQIVTARPESLGDVIIARKDTPTSYHLSVVHDDALQGVTHIIRGEDLRASTHIHVLLQHLLGLPRPVYFHHPLLAGPDGKRFAKRDGAVTLAALRASGLSPADIRARIGLPA
ncbi:MAG: tRNA glutamyl-Q(34) synthetase GluQRS [Rhodobacterales bacterium 12-64-8]|nr:MAG: tRNA glutamyl-Q(34) synthetase GluQRS [Rhodobacterales bacterium 12-64-8]OYX50057.1 MAG: tRNA glutamyl-Q(34) synthetase GluQRS [Alphaproteobacteria bacterium 32-64-14]